MQQTGAVPKIRAKHVHSLLSRARIQALPERIEAVEAARWKIAGRKRHPPDNSPEIRAPIRSAAASTSGSDTWA